MFKFFTGRNHGNLHNDDLSDRVEMVDAKNASTHFLKFAEPCCYRGFPPRPSCIAFDEVLRLLALGTRDGEIRIHGKPGVYLSVRSSNSIRSLDFCAGGRGRLISMCESGVVEVWQISDTSSGLHIRCITNSPPELSARLKMYTAHTLLENGTKLAVGLECGDIVFVDLFFPICNIQL